MAREAVASWEKCIVDVVIPALQIKIIDQTRSGKERPSITLAAHEERNTNKRKGRREQHPPSYENPELHLASSRKAHRFLHA